MDRDWMIKGECRNREVAEPGVTLWDTDIPSSGTADQGTLRRRAEKRMQLAKSICKHICTVAPDCLEYALEHPELTSAGIWGGTDPKERAKLRQHRERFSQ